jgi:hypothetical protein
LNIRLTVLSAEYNAPLLSMNVNSSSLQEPAVRKGCSALLELYKVSGVFANKQSPIQ